MAKNTLDKLRNDELDISFDDDGKVTYQEKKVNDNDDNDVIKVFIHKNDTENNATGNTTTPSSSSSSSLLTDFDADDNTKPEILKKKVTIIEPVIGIDINKYLESKKKADEVASSSSVPPPPSSSSSSSSVVVAVARKIQQPLIELLDIQMKPSDDAINDDDDLHHIIADDDDLKSPERWIPDRTTSIKEKMIDNKFIIKKPIKRNTNRPTRSSLHEPKYKSVPKYDHHHKKEKVEKRGIVINIINDDDDDVTISDKKNDYMIKAMKGHNICIPRL